MAFLTLIWISHQYFYFVKIDVVFKYTINKYFNVESKMIELWTDFELIREYSCVIPGAQLLFMMSTGLYLTLRKFSTHIKTKQQSSWGS